jgi:7-cyano-7-deazaguanine synthase in queuosine biosynthesis
MAQYILRAHLGPLDPLPTAPADVADVDLMAANRYLAHGIGRAMADAVRLGMSPTEIALDLLILAALVYAADTRIPRVAFAQDSWSREIRLELPVHDPARWTAAAPLLQRLLRFLSGDIWEVVFRPRSPALMALAPQRPLQAPTYDGVCLFSGGLDSLVGTINLLSAGRRPLLVSHAAEGATSDAQNTLIELLSKRFGATDRLRFWIAFTKTLLDQEGSKEDTTRARSFLFFAAATFAASAVFDREITIAVPENGLISLNVPLDPLRLGSLSTRTTHPFYLARWNELLQALAIPARLETPYLHKTKGEMLADCADQELLRVALAGSMSCSSPTKGRWIGRSTEHCGYCVPCLIRRAAITAAFGDDPTPYTLQDLRARNLNTASSEGRQVRSFQLAAERVAAHPEIAAALIHKPGPLNDPQNDVEQLAAVYQRGMAEVAALLNGVTARPA